MQTFIKLQNVLTDPKKSFQEFKQELIESKITQFTYLCLLLNITVTIKRTNFNFEPYLDLLINFKPENNYRSACINYTGYKDSVSILMNACQKSVFSTVKVLATHPDIKLHLIDPNGFNAVFYAIKNPDENQAIKILELLYTLSPQIIDTVTNNGYSPLFLAVQKNILKIVEFLLKNGTDPNQRLVSSGNTGLHEMVKLHQKYSLEETRKMIEVFLRYGFDLNAKNNQQKTVQEYGLDSKFNIKEILQEILSNQQKIHQQNVFIARQLSETTQIYSSKMATTKIGDIFTSCEYSQVERSEFNNEIDALSISNKSLLSQEINYMRYEDERQFSLDMNLVNNLESLLCAHDQNEIDQIESKIQCQSLKNCPQVKDCDLDFGQNLLAQNYDKIGQKVQDREASQSFSDTESSMSEDQPSELFLKTQNVDFLKIHKQILQFDEISQSLYFSAWQQIEPFFIKLSEVTLDLNLSIEIIGSFATGLWTHHSDIDIALVTQSQSFVDFQRLLQKVYSKIKVKMYDMGIKQLSFNKASKIPSLKIQMDPYLFSSRKIDIMIFHKKNTAMTYVNYIRESSTIYYQIRPLFFFLKRACEQFGLHDPFNGGMKSYSIFLIINSIIRSLQLTNLGQILLKISLYFGFYHTYDYEIQCHHNIKLHLYEYTADPLNTKNNMGGKNTNVSRLKQMFRTIYYGIHKQNDSQTTTLQNILEMAQLVI